MAMLARRGFNDNNYTFDPIRSQRNIYRWYDRRYSDDAFNIYSPEWGNKLVYWQKNSPAIDIGEARDELEIGTFFRSDPVAAFSLWKLLQVCYDLDEAVCGSTTDAKTMASWKSFRPFEYLGSDEVRKEWSRSLEKLRQRIKNSDEESDGHREPWEARMWAILQAVEKFEEAFAVLQENFKANLKQKRKCAEWMESRISDEMGTRFSLITNLLEIKDGEFSDLDDQDGSTRSSRPSTPRNFDTGANRNYDQQPMKLDAHDTGGRSGVLRPSKLHNIVLPDSDPKTSQKKQDSKLRTEPTRTKRRASVVDRHKHRFQIFKKFLRWRQKSNETEQNTTEPLFSD